MEQFQDKQNIDTDEWWDQNSVQCGNCSVRIITRGGSIPDNNGLSKAEGEDEALCGRCAGAQMYEYSDQLDIALSVVREGGVVMQEGKL